MEVFHQPKPSQWSVTSHLISPQNTSKGWMRSLTTLLADRMRLVGPQTPTKTRPSDSVMEDVSRLAIFGRPWITQGTRWRGGEQAKEEADRP